MMWRYEFYPQSCGSIGRSSNKVARKVGVIPGNNLFIVSLRLLKQLQRSFKSRCHSWRWSFNSWLKVKCRVTKTGLVGHKCICCVKPNEQENTRINHPYLLFVKIIATSFILFDHHLPPRWFLAHPGLSLVTMKTTLVIDLLEETYFLKCLSNICSLDSGTLPLWVSGWVVGSQCFQHCIKQRVLNVGQGTSFPCLLAWEGEV